MILLQELYRTYWVELIALWVLLIMVIVLLRGIRANYEVAINWFKLTQEFLESNFSRSALMQKSFWMDSWSQFDIFATGRKNFSYVYMNVICKPRQDILTGILFQPFLRNYDKVYVEIPIQRMGPIMILICNKKELKSTLIEYPEIEIHCSPKKVNSLSKDTAIYANSNACLDIIMDSGTISKFISSKMVERLVSYIYISDQTACPRLTNSYSKVTSVFKACIRVPSKDDINMMNELNFDLNYLFKHLLFLCEMLMTIDLPAKTVQYIANNRLQIEKTLNKINDNGVNERIEAKRREKIRSEAAKISRMSPKEQKKYQEKKEKQQARSRIKLKVSRS
ncbi:signal peptide-containing protein [Cryptosporidium canis]|uniref:Signal peptide-containing protein n=1 Tax=Cryptosporidium canis TaxID=195482 RepID=A0A9D5HYB6_9CRYT|nr:signal peptide-containing protein [Cryptosporidium canis]